MYRKRKIIILTTLVVVTLALLVFSRADTTNSSELYERVKTETTTNGRGATYSGTHQDSLAGTGTQAIYYYTDGNYDNVIFGNYCWKIIRTTDTGGVKLLYNGVKSASNTCTNTGANSQINTGSFINSSAAETTPSAVGYMFNGAGEIKTKAPSYEPVLSKTTTLFTTSHYYGTSISYTSSKYKLGGTINKTRAAKKYTVRSTSNTGTATKGYYITNVDGSTFYYLTLTGGSLLAAVNKYFQYGNNISTLDAGNGTSFRSAAYLDNYAGMRQKYYRSGTSASQTSSGTAKYALEADDEQIYYISTNQYKFGMSVTYSNGTYTLNSTTDKPDTTHHYTCWTSGTTCSNASYLYTIDEWGNMFYLDLNGEVSINTLLTKMFWNDSVNTTASGAKSKIDTWYANNMTSYTKYLEDAVWCNDRSAAASGNYVASNNGFNFNGGLLYRHLTGFYALQNFRGTIMLKGSTYQQNLDCPHTRDRFTVGNTIAKLTYPVGLITAQEGYMATTSVVNSGSSYWTMTPCSVDKLHARIRRVDDTGDVVCDSVEIATHGIRPAVSLKSGIEYTGGTGTPSDPYVVELRHKITTSATNGTITATSYVDSGTNKTISYSPNTGYKLKSVTVDGTNVSISTYPTSYTFSNVTAYHTISVEFELADYQITVANKVTGSMADLTKTFNYTVVKDASDATVSSLGTTFTLTGNASKVLTIPYSYKVTVTQDSASPYTTTVNNTNSRTITRTVTGNETIQYINSYSLSPSTEVKIKIIPYIVLIIVVIFSLGLFDFFSYKSKFY